MMTSTVAERPAHYDAPKPEAVKIPSRPISPMNSIGEGATPLMYACQQSRDQDVRSILTKKPDAARERDRTMKTALHYCAESSSLTCADLVLSAAHDLVDARDEDGYTPIHLAVIAGNKPLIKFLLSKNADVNSLDYERHSVVHWATVCGEVEALELVLDAGANPSTPDIHGGYPIHYAAQMCGPNSEMGNDVRFGLAVLRKLLARGVEVNVRDKDGRQPILWAASAGSADAILALVNAGANVEADDKDGLTALHCAASRGHTDCIETLVTLCGAEVDVIDSNGCTALFYAVTLGHADSTQLLLSFGAEPNRQDRKGRTPAHCGAAKGQLETLRLLGSHGANLWVRNVKGDYPLHEAVVSGRKDLVRWLLTQRSDAVNSPNNDGRCPLHITAINNNVEMCKILLDSQALLNPVMRTSKGQLMTPIDAALHRGNRGCAKYLQLHGGVPASKLTDKSARIRGGNQRGAMSETQSEQYTTPEFAASLSLPGGQTSLGTSPVGDHAATLNDPGRRTLQVRMNDDVAIRHVERIDAPLICTHRRFDDDSSGEERMRRRRRRRRREHRRRDYVDDVDSEVVEEDLRRRRRGGRRNDEFSDSADSELRKRRRKRRDDEFSDDWDSETERRNRRRWRRRGDRTASSERSDEEEQDMADDVSDSNWVRNKKRRGEKMERPQRRSKSKEESENENSEAEYVRVKRTTTKSKKTKRKTVTDEEQEEHIEESSERDSEVEVEEKIEQDMKKENSEVTTKSSKREKVTTTTKAKTKIKDDKSKSKEDSNIVHKVDSRRSKKKEVALEKDARKKQETSSNKTTESESKIVDGSKSKISKTFVKKESSTRRKTEASKDNDTTKKSTKKVIRKGVRQVENNGEPNVVDKVVEKIRVEETEEESLQRREAYRQSQAPMSLEEDGVTQRVVTALVHQHEDEGSPEVPHEGEQMESAERGEGGQKDGSDAVQDTGNVEGQNIMDDARKSPEREEKPDAGGGEGTEVADLKPSKGNTEGEEKKDDTDGDISKSADSESRKSRISGEGEGNITIKEGEAETNEDTKKETESGVEIEDKAKHEDEEDEVKSHNIGGEVEACRSERKEAEEEREGRAEGEEKGKLMEDGERKNKDEYEEDGDVTKKINNFGEEQENAEQKDSKSAAKDVSEHAESRGPQADKETQELKRDIKENEEGDERDKTDEDSRSSTRDLTMTSPLEKEESAEREVNGESGASTARSRNGGDSSVLLDSGFEPSPRRDKDTTTTSSNNQQTRSARGSRGPSRGRGRGRIPRPCRTDDEQPMTTVSVTQAVQRSMRKYHLERRIFQELLELKRLQIRAGRANEQVLVKRLVDEYHKAGLTVGMRQYDGAYTFRSFEKYLYDQLRLLQSSDRRLIPRLKSSDDLEKLTAALRRARFNSAYLDDIPDNPILCTHGTHRCHHAAHAYTGIPCAAYVTKVHHHAPKSGHAGSSRSGFLPRIDPNSRGTGRNSSAIPRSLSYVDPSRPVTLELSHGSEKQVISLPTERLDRNKRYYVTFTIKGGPNGSKADKQAQPSEERTDLRHRHSESL